MPRIERTVVILKPEALGQETQIAKQIEETIGLSVTEDQFRIELTAEKADQIYAGIAGKSHHDDAVEAIRRGVVTCFLVEGRDAIAKVREFLGSSQVDAAVIEPGKLRGALIRTQGFVEGKWREFGNYVHASDSPESAEREIGACFPDLANI